MAKTGVRVIDLTSQLGGQALGQIGETLSPSDIPQTIALSKGDGAPTVEWAREKHIDQPLNEAAGVGALVMLVGPGAVRPAKEVLQRALQEKVRCIRVFVTPSAFIEEITLQALIPKDDESAHLYRLPDSSPETLWFVLIEEFQKLSSLYGLGSLQPDESDTEQHMSSNLKQSMESAMAIDGALAAALVDYKSGMCLAQAGTAMNLDLAAAGNTEVVRAKLQTVESLGLRRGIEDILITLVDQYHLIRLVPNTASLFLYLVLDKNKGNLALARYKLTDIERSLKV